MPSEIDHENIDWRADGRGRRGLHRPGGLRFVNAMYPALFEDVRGAESTILHNDGSELRMVVRGVAFVGQDFDAFSPEAEDMERARGLFTLRSEDLFAYRLQWTMPLGMEWRGERYAAALAAALTLGWPTANGGVGGETLVLELRARSGVVRSSGRSGWFEDELLELRSRLGEEDVMRACFSCAFSDYNPVGHGLFGGLACFRGVKEAYARVQDKRGIFDLWSRRTEYVQETHVCEEHRPRAPGTGYRG